MSKIIYGIYLFVVTAIIAIGAALFLFGLFWLGNFCFH
jgi:hypothetical protein